MVQVHSPPTTRPQSDSAKPVRVTVSTQSKPSAVGTQTGPIITNSDKHCVVSCYHRCINCVGWFHAKCCDYEDELQHETVMFTQPTCRLPQVLLLAQKQVLAAE